MLYLTGMNIYFSGIGGVGIGPLAEIASDAGYTVHGSDFKESPITKELHSRGVDISTSQDGSFLQACHQAEPIDWFVYTSSLPENHPELVLAKKLGIKTTKRHELLNHIITDKKLKLIAVAGTHGKTTTTGMLIWTLKQLKTPISYSIGTTIAFGPSGQFNTGSRYFIYECDEFDHNFLHFKPDLALITSVGYDHFDTYPTEQAYLDAFRQFAKQSHQLIAWSDQHQEIFHSLTQVSLLSPTLIDNSLPLAGWHNRRNAALVKAALVKLGFTGDLSNILARFPGTSRRFEKLADNLYTDYAHHPTEIAATIQLAREISDHVVVIYQPHQNIRQHKLKNKYSDCFKEAEEIYWLTTYLTREDPSLPVLTPKQLSAAISADIKTHFAKLDDNLWRSIQTARQTGKLVLCLGAGDIDSWLRSKLQAA